MRSQQGSRTYTMWACDLCEPLHLRTPSRRRKCSLPQEETGTSDKQATSSHTNTLLSANDFRFCLLSRSSLFRVKSSACQLSFVFLSAPHAVIQTKDNKRAENNMWSFKMNSSEMSQDYNSIFATVLKSSHYVKHNFSNLLHPFVTTKDFHSNLET